MPGKKLYNYYKKLKLPKHGKECLKLSFFPWLLMESFVRNGFTWGRQGWQGATIKEILKFYKK
jgi:hypothetical protein